jgi:hypothetical protein
MNPGSIQGVLAKSWAETRMPSTRKQRRAVAASVVWQK